MRKRKSRKATVYSKPSTIKPDAFERWLSAEKKIYIEHAKHSDEAGYIWVAGRDWLCSLVVRDIISEYRRFLRAKRGEK